MTLLINKTLRLFLDSIGRREEYEYYLNRFQSGDTTAFALLCPERTGFEEMAPVFAFDLEFLLRLELAPVIVLAGPKVNEMRALLLQGDQPFRAMESMDPSGDLDKVQAFVQSCQESGQAAVLGFPEQQREDVLPILAPSLARRIHFVRAEGPPRSASGDIIPYIYLSRLDQRPLASSDQQLVDIAERLLNRHPSLHVSIASPWNLLQELFTVKGAGCVIRRGSIIEQHTTLDTVDQPCLAQLLEDSFRRPLLNPDRLVADELFIEKHYRGAALLERHAAGFYLSKFAVGTQARGEGLANELWDKVCDGHPNLFWRARSGNPINHWYERQADGHHNAGIWRVFWRGIPYPELPAIIDYSLNRADDFTRAP